jgi:ankyrin repeat protein
MNVPSDFHQAVIENRVADVKRFLKEDETPDSLACVLAIQNKANRVLKVLIDAGANVNALEAYWRYTPLVRALHERNLVAFRMLLKAGASVHKEGTSGPPLHFAAYKGFVNVAKLCIAAGARLDQRDCSGNTPLMLAASAGQLKMVKVLLKAGANPLALNRADRTPCELAAENNKAEIVKLLAPISRRKPPVKRGIQALILAVSKLDMHAVEKCLAKGIDVNKRDRFGRSPLNNATSLGSVSMVKRLIEAGINLNTVDSDGISFLEGALRSEKLEIAKILIEAGAVSDPPGNRFEDALYTVSGIGSSELVKMLMAKSSQSSRSVALIQAANRKSLELMKVLLEAGADVNVTDFQGRTPLSLVMYTPPINPQTKRVIRLPIGTVAKNLDDRQSVEAVELLLKYGANVNQVDDAGRTPMSYSNSARIAKRLIEAGARLDLKDKEGLNARHWLRNYGIEVRGQSTRLLPSRRRL